MKKSAEIVICGAGIAGIATAYFLSQRGVRDILIVDERGPLELTSGHSTECYRNWWGDPAMVMLMNRSIDLLERLADQNGNSFGMNRRGYLYVTGNNTRVTELIERSRKIADLGAGQIRLHRTGSSTYLGAEPEGYEPSLDGADILLGNELIRHHFPGITERAAAAVHVRRAGWLSAQQLGMILLEGARCQGIGLVNAGITRILKRGGKVVGVQLSSGEIVRSRTIINAAGPFLNAVGRMVGIELPVQTELHLKVAFRDPLGIIDRNSPLLIWDDPQFLPWTDDERASLGDDQETAHLLESFPPGAHTRPEGARESQMALMLWEFNNRSMQPVWPLPSDEQYPEIVLRGLAAMLPGLQRYFGHAPRPQVDGGYYTKTIENRALVGRTEVDGFYIIGALSGYGIMSACGFGDLLADIITGSPLPGYAPEFSLDRYADPEYLATIAGLGDNGQL